MTRARARARTWAVAVALAVVGLGTAGCTSNDNGGVIVPPSANDEHTDDTVDADHADHHRRRLHLPRHPAQQLGRAARPASGRRPAAPWAARGPARR